MNRRTALLVFPALSIVFSASCASAQPHSSDSSAAVEVSAPDSTVTGSVTKSSAAGAAGSGLALDVLRGIRIAKEQNAGYVRAKFVHWVDADGDSCDTREEVLIAESTSKAQVDPYGCKVVEGDWWSAYDGVTTTSPSTFDIDHFVPLKEAWGSGAWSWNAAKRQAYANDLSDARALIAVTASSNRSKGDKDPTQWMPANGAVTCAYLSDWVAVKAHWSLSMDESEYRYIDKRLKSTCSGTQLAAWGKGTPLGAAVGSTPGTSQTTVPAGLSTGSTAPDTTVSKGSSAVVITPGAFCSPVGAKGTSAAGKSYVCSLTSATGTPYAGGRARWRAG